ncbi:MAG: hypothetical protein M3Q10_02695 [Chloroflexota bacterium]|nr:hypothetical protein [Chloroflexota bacterium]
MPATDRFLHVELKDRARFLVLASYDEWVWGWVADVREGDAAGDPVWDRWATMIQSNSVPSFQTPHECLVHAIGTLVEFHGVDTA